MGPWAFGVPLALVSALGLLLNAYILVVIGLGKQTQQQQQAAANTLLLIHLGAVEAAVCLVLLIFATGTWPAAGTWCVIHGFLLALLHPVALWTVTGLNCDRYYAIAAPLHYSAVVSPRRVALGLGISWAGALLLCLPPFSGLVPPYRYVPGLGCCAPDFGQAGWGSAGALYGAIYALLGLALPALLVTLCNLRVLGIARYHRHRIASAIYEVTLSAQVTITHQRNPFFVPAVTAPSAGGPPRFHSAASTVMQLVGSLYLLYFPYCGLILWEACGSGGAGSGNSSLSSGTSSLFGSIAQQPQQQQAAVARLHAVHPRFASLASLLLACSPPINGLLYGLKSRMLRRSVQNYWRKKATKSELQQEIQARTPSAAGSRRPSVTGGPSSSSFFPFPPLQRRLSEALIALGNCRAAAAGFGSGNIANMFHRARLQPAASCNTLRVPNAELGESRRLVRSSASAASLMGAHYRNDFVTGGVVGAGGALATAVANGTASTTALETPKRSPRILITRAYSEESQDGGSPLLRKPFAAPISLPPCEKRRWRHRSTESDSSTGSSDASVWTTGVQAAKPPRAAGANGKNPSDMWPCGRRFTRVKTLEEGAAVFSVVLANRMAINNNNSSESSDIATDVAAANGQAVRAPINGQQQQQQQQQQRVAESEISCDEKDEEEEEEEVVEVLGVVEVGRRTPEDEQRASASSSSWSCAEDNTAHSALNSRASSECGLVMHPIGETTENSHPKQEDEQEEEEEEEEEEGVCRPGGGGGGGKRARRKSRIAREAETTIVVVDQLRPLLTSSS